MWTKTEKQESWVSFGIGLWPLGTLSTWQDHGRRVGTAGAPQCTPSFFQSIPPHPTGFPGFGRSSIFSFAYASNPDLISQINQRNHHTCWISLNLGGINWRPLSNRLVRKELFTSSQALRRNQTFCKRNHSSWKCRKRSSDLRLGNLREKQPNQKKWKVKDLEKCVTFCKAIIATVLDEGVVGEESLPKVVETIDHGNRVVFNGSNYVHVCNQTKINQQESFQPVQLSAVSLKISNL